MKKILLIAIAAIFFAGCDKQETPETPPRNISFTVSGFTHQTTPVGALQKSGSQTMASDSTQLKDHISTLKFLLFDAQGKLVVQKSQTSDAAGFGTFSERIKDGKYTAFFIGGPGEPTLDLSTFTISNLLSTRDTYIKHMEFNVAQEDKTMNVVLERFGAKLKIKLTDPFPSDIKALKFHVKLLDKLNFVTKAAETSQPDEGAVYVFDPEVRTKDATLEMFCALFPGQSYTVTGFLKAYDKDNNVVYNREIKDITLEHNKLTTVTGNAFFDYTEGFTIKIDTDYAGNIDQTF